MLTPASATTNSMFQISTNLCIRQCSRKQRKCHRGLALKYSKLILLQILCKILQIFPPIVLLELLVWTDSSTNLYINTSPVGRMMFSLLFTTFQLTRATSHVTTSGPWHVRLVSSSEFGFISNRSFADLAGNPAILSFSKFYKNPTIFCKDLWNCIES